jgi:large subunit ribosomal protein L30e
MANKKKLTSSEIKKLIKEKKFLIGKDRTLKSLKLGKVDLVIISSNCAKDTLESINYYSSLSGIKTDHVNYHNDELGVICKKPFSISVISILKGD